MLCSRCPERTSRHTQCKSGASVSDFTHAGATQQKDTQAQRRTRAQEVWRAQSVCASKARESRGARQQQQERRLNCMSRSIDGSGLKRHHFWFASRLPCATTRCTLSPTSADGCISTSSGARFCSPNTATCTRIGVSAALIFRDRSTCVLTCRRWRRLERAVAVRASSFFLSFVLFE